MKQNGQQRVAFTLHTFEKSSDYSDFQIDVKSGRTSPKPLLTRGDPHSIRESHWFLCVKNSHIGMNSTCAKVISVQNSFANHSCISFSNFSASGSTGIVKKLNWLRNAWCKARRFQSVYLGFGICLKLSFILFKENLLALMAFALKMCMICEQAF